MLIHLGVLREVCRADMINGSAEAGTTISRTTTRDAAGAVTSTARTEDFTHRYNVSLDMNPFPLLKISAGSIFQQEFSSVQQGNGDLESTDTTFTPRLDLLLTNNNYLAGVGYSRTQMTEKTTLMPSSTAANEEYHSTLAWKPDGFPDVVLRLSHANIFDPLQASAKTTTNTGSLSSKYRYKNLNLGYSVTATDTRAMENTETTLLEQTFGANYSHQFFERRVSIYANYNVSYREATTHAGGSGTADTPLYPVTAFYAYNNTPTVGTTTGTAIATADQSVDDRALIDGNMQVSAGINIGTVPSGGDLTKQWSIGIDFFNLTEVNTMLVWVDRDLPPAIAAGFSWQVYVRNSDTDNWSTSDAEGHSTAVTAVTFGPFQKSFRISFGTVKARFIKVVVTPLSQGVAVLNPSFKDPDKIFVTELQGVLDQPTAQLQHKTSSIGQSVSFNVRSRLLDTVPLYHDMNLFLTTNSDGGTTYNLINNFNVEHRFNRIVSGTASAGREDSASGEDHSSAYLYNASLMATPLSGLNDTVVYSGRIDQTGKGTRYSNSIFLANTAQIYKGVALNMSGGYSFGTGLQGEEVTGVSLLCGASIVPREDLSINFSYSRNSSSVSRSGAATSTTSSQNGNAAVSYRAFPNLYLFASFGVVAPENGTPQLTQQYGTNWSPFVDGNLQFQLSYSQGFTTINNARTTLLTPSLSWKFALKASLDVSYANMTSSSTLGSSASDVVSAAVRFSF